MKRQREAQAVERAIKRDAIMRRMEAILEVSKAGIVFLATQEELAGVSVRWRNLLGEIEDILKEAQS